MDPDQELRSTEKPGAPPPGAAPPEALRPVSGVIRTSFTNRRYGGGGYLVTDIYDALGQVRETLEDMKAIEPLETSDSDSGSDSESVSGSDSGSDSESASGGDSESDSESDPEDAAADLPPLSDEDGWAAVSKLNWALRSDEVLSAAQVRGRRNALSPPERRLLRTWMEVKGEALVAVVPELGEKIAGSAAIELVALGENWFVNVLQDPSLAQYYLDERQEEGLLDLALPT